MYRVAQQVMKGEHDWLETGIISMLDNRSEGASLSQTQDEMRVPVSR